VKAFYHDIPEAERRKLVWKNFNPKHKNVYRGLSPFLPNVPEHKELYDMGSDMELISDEALKLPLYEETPFPPQQKYQYIKKFFNQHYNKMHKLTLKLAEFIALGLKKDRHFFRDWFEYDSMSTLRSVHLIPRDAGVVDSSKLDKETFRLTTPEHADSGFITLLSTLGYPGLQV